MVQGLKLIRPVEAIMAIADAWLMRLLAWRLAAPLGLGAGGLGEGGALGVGEMGGEMGGQRGVGVTMALLAVAVLGLHIYATAMNDLLDVRHDRLFSPDRPLASGRLELRWAVALSVLSLLVALLASMWLGFWSMGLALIAAALALFYNVLGKHFPGAGLLSLGLFRGSLMLLGCPQMGLLWPLWLTLTHNLAYLGLVNRLAGRGGGVAGGWPGGGSMRRPLGMNQIWTLCLGWSVMTFLMVGWMRWRQAMVPWGHGPLLLWPLLAGLVFAFWVWLGVARQAQSLRERSGASRSLLRLGRWWTLVYALVWLAGLGAWSDASWIVGLAILAWVIPGAMPWLEEWTQSPPSCRWF